jgi:hypothetical protein
MATRAPRLDPAIAELIRALARADADRDYAALQKKEVQHGDRAGPGTGLHRPAGL